MDELKKVIDLKPLSDESIKEHKYALSDLWMVKDDNGSIHGPFPTDQLREYSQKYQYLFEASTVYNLETEKWYKFFEVKHFQRRKPRLVSAQNLISDNSFYVLVNGQKNGPFTLEKMQKLLNTGRILPHTQISLDEGESWIKLYEHHAFDRRTKKTNQELPFIPDQKILSESTKTNINISEFNDPLIELASLSQEDKTLTQVTKTLSRTGIKTKTQIMKNPLLEEEEKTIVGRKINLGEKRPEGEIETKSKNKWSVVFASFVLIAMVGVAGSYFAGIFNEGTTLKEPQQAQTKTQGINNTDRTIKTKAQRRKPASVRAPRFKPSNQPNRIKAKRYVPKPRRVVERVEHYEEPEDTLDINDPEVQEELTRSLAGEYEDDMANEDNEYPEDEYDQEENGENFDEPVEDPYYDEPADNQGEGGDYEYDAPYDE